MDKYPIITYIGAGILTWTAGEMILKDKSLNSLVDLPHGAMSYAILAIVTVMILVTGYVKNQGNARKVKERQA
jgi:predicted tellurium resistance membrane protein TerC